MDQSIWDEEKEFVVFDDNSETTIWEDLERGPCLNNIEKKEEDKQNLKIEREDVERLDKGIVNGKTLGLYTTIWEDLYKYEEKENKKLIKNEEPNKLSTDLEKRDFFTFEEEKNSSQLLIYPPYHSSNTPQTLLRSSRSNSNTSNGNECSITKNSSYISGTKSPFSTKVSRRSSGASMCQGRRANGPDGTIGFHKGRAGESLREQKDDINLNRAFAAMSFLEEIEDNHGDKSCQRNNSHSNSRVRNSKSQKILHTKTKKNSRNVAYLSSDSHHHPSNLCLIGIPPPGIKQAITPPNSTNRKLSSRSAFDFSSPFPSPIFSNDNGKLKDPMNNLEKKGTQSLTMTCRRLPLKIEECRSSSLSIPHLTKKTSRQSERLSSEIADEEARLDARIAHLSHNALGLENEFCRSSCKYQFFDFGVCEQSRYLESFSR